MMELGEKEGFLFFFSLLVFSIFVQLDCIHAIWARRGVFCSFLHTIPQFADMIRGVIFLILDWITDGFDYCCPPRRSTILVFDCR